MSTIKVKSCNEFCIGHFKSRSDVKRSKDIEESLIFNALNKSKEFSVRDWFDDHTDTIFTITNIEKTKYGDYIYTIESNVPCNKNYFPSVLMICEDFEDIASPTSYSIL